MSLYHLYIIYNIYKRRNTYEYVILCQLIDGYTRATQVRKVSIVNVWKVDRRKEVRSTRTEYICLRHVRIQYYTSICMLDGPLTHSHAVHTCTSAHVR